MTEGDVLTLETIQRAVELLRANNVPPDEHGYYPLRLHSSAVEVFLQWARYEERLRLRVRYGGRKGRSARRKLVYLGVML